MPRILPDSLIDEAIRLYEETQSFAKTAAILGKDPESLRLALRRRGIKALPKTGRPSPKRIAAPPNLEEVYHSGESVNQMAKTFNVSRPVINRWLRDAGLPIRGRKESSRIRWENISEEELEMRRAHAKKFFTGRKRSPEEQLRAADTRARKALDGSRKRSHLEVLFGNWLADRGVSYVPEQVVAGYNVDFGIAPVAVELLGGNWHAANSRRAYHAKRTHDILNAGWSIIFAWSQSQVPISEAAADQVVSLLEVASSDPAPVGKYWVVRGDGQLMSSGGDEGDNFTLVVPSIADLNIRP